ncbi:MAG: hypothetical protein WCL16_06400 [bacterium]
MNTERFNIARRGSGLIIVLWVLALLSILVSSFAFEMHTEARVLSYYRKQMKAEHLARSGHEVALMLLNRSMQIHGVSTDEKSEPWYEAAARLKQGLAIRNWVAQLGEGEIRLDIIPEPGLRNVNTLTDEDWERVLTVGGVPEALWRTLIDSFEDWRDGDDTPQLDGAETEDYYARLTPPYKARGHNGHSANLDTVDELRLIRGFTREIVYGGPNPEGGDKAPPMTGIADLLRAGAADDRLVNINAASRRVLLTLPGITEPLADRIMTVREGLTDAGTISEDSQFKSAADVFARVGELISISPDDRQHLNALISTVSPVFTVTSRGVVHGVEKTITHVVMAGQEKSMPGIVPPPKAVRP